MAENEITSLKEAMCNQLLVMKKLYRELEEEREASASGADEALSMILRLQKEKAEEKMEACNYRRMTEAKLHHAEESITIFEEILLQKEIENASLKHQMQAYKHMLLSIGINYSDIGGTKISNSRRFSDSDFSEKTSSWSKIRRHISMPSDQFNKLCSEMDFIDGDGSLVSALRSIRRGFGDYKNQLQEYRKQYLPKESAIEECIPNWQQAREVNRSPKGSLQWKKVKHKLGLDPISTDDNYQSKIRIDPQSCEEESRLRFRCSSVNIGAHTSSIHETESIGNTIQHIDGQNIFEVPKYSNECIISESSKKALQEFTSESKQMIKMPNSKAQEGMDYVFEKVKFANNAPTLSVSRKAISINHHPKLVDVKQLRDRIHQLEDDVKEQVELLKDIHDQLKTVSSHLKNSKSKKYSPVLDETAFVSLTEAMLSFSI